MTPGKLDLTIYQGATFSRTLLWEAGQPPAPVNLTGYTARMQLRVTPDSGFTLLALTTENSRITLGGAAGTIVLSLSAADTAALAFPRAVYDLELVSPGGVVRRLVEGEVSLSKEVTR